MKDLLTGFGRSLETHHVLLHRKSGPKEVVLHDVGAVLVKEGLGHDLPVDLYLSVDRSTHAERESVQGRGLSGSGRPDDSERLTQANIACDVFDQPLVGIRKLVACEDTRSVGIRSRVKEA